MPSSFHPLHIPIQGINLIEASAGTGKTWNIAALFARLVLLEQMPVDKILVVTFTKAATAELKTRLRARLNDALRVLQKYEDGQDIAELCQKYAPDAAAFLAELLQKAMANESPERLVIRLKAAISQFDHASIYTIHGFCQRVLQDFAFYCQVPFSLEMDEEQHRQDYVAAQDYWRATVAHDDTLAQLVYRHRQTPQHLAARVQSFLARPYLKTQPVGKTADFLRQAEQDYRRAWQHAAAQWPQVQAAFLDEVQPKLNKKSYEPQKYADFCALLAQHAEQGDEPPVSTVLEYTLDSKGGNKFRADYLLAKIAKAQQAAQNRETLAFLEDTLGGLVETAQTAEQAEQNALIGLTLALLDDWRVQNEHGKQQQTTRQFDDLLLDVFHALQENRTHAAALSQAMARQWRVALIDEFQDTDPLQYDIFRRAFATESDTQKAACTPAWFMVGDPKQAIYSFRGADIFAYLAAAETAEHRYTLTTNHRSHARLINSIGALFARDKPFALDHLPYEPVSAGRAEKRLPEHEPSVLLRWLNDLHECGDTAEAADTLRHRAADWCAREIARSLHLSAQGQFHIGSLPLEAGQIAVLIRSHRDGGLMQRTLKKYGIKSVLMSRENLFAQEEATAVCALLEFWLKPQKTELLVYVLAGCLFGYTAADVQALLADDAQLAYWTESALQAQQDWQQWGVYAAIQHFLQQNGVITRLLAQGSERMLTNIGQIMELLAAEDEQGRNETALQQWLAQEIAQSTQSGGAESRLLRLESDEHLVKIVTMHAAKGLQYPIVYCPFVWNGGNASADEWQVVQRSGENWLLHKTQLEDGDRESVVQAQLSEDLRLLYVALTRAEEQLNLYMAAGKNTHRSDFYYLLDAPPQESGKKTIAPAAYRKIWQEFIARQDAQNTDFVLTDEPPPPFAAPERTAAAEHEGQPLYRAVPLPQRRYAVTRHTSFTALTRNMPRQPYPVAAEELLQPALDSAEQHPLPALPAAQEQERSMADFPAGTGVGVCLHSLLEYFRFQQAACTQSARTARVLAQYSIDADMWLDTVNDMLDKVRQTPLIGGKALCDFPPEQRLAELDFLFPIQQFDLAALPQWLAESGLDGDIVQAAFSLTAQQVSGFLNGAIDLLLWHEPDTIVVADYKSNRLPDYAPESLTRAIAEHHYYLQALIYAIAAARYCQSRKIAVRHIAVRYLFLRGMDGESSAGVWSWDIPMERLQPWLIHGGDA